MRLAHQAVPSQGVPAINGLDLPCSAKHLITCATQPKLQLMLIKSNGTVKDSVAEPAARCIPEADTTREHAIRYKAVEYNSTDLSKLPMVSLKA